MPPEEPAERAGPCPHLSRSQAALGSREASGGQSPAPWCHEHTPPSLPHGPPATILEVKQAELCPENAPQPPRVSRWLQLPGAWLAQPPESPAKAWHRCPERPLLPPASPRGLRTQADCFPLCGLAPAPQEKVCLPPPGHRLAQETRGLQAARSPGLTESTCSRTSPGNQIPAADDSRGWQDRVPIQPPLEPAWPDLAAASPTWALRRLSPGLT